MKVLFAISKHVVNFKCTDMIAENNDDFNPYIGVGNSNTNLNGDGLISGAMNMSDDKKYYPHIRNLIISNAMKITRAVAISRRVFTGGKPMCIPITRWTAYAAERYNVKLPPEVPMFLHESAYTSAIWYTF